MFCVTQLYGGERPMFMVVKHGGERKPSAFPIHDPRKSIGATDICINALNQCYEDDLGGEIWPVRKGTMQ